MSDPSQIVEMERRLLAFLCQGGGDTPLYGRARELLADYRWNDAAHRSLFEIVMSLPRGSCELLRDQLPARLMRRGFPDFDFQALFTMPAPSGPEAEAYLKQLTVRSDP